MGAYARTHSRRDRGPKGPHRSAASLGVPRIAGGTRFGLGTLLPAVVGNGSNNRVLILDSTVTGGANSIEAKAAAEKGYGVDIVDAATWSSMTAEQFAAYRAIVLGDPTCGDESLVAAAEANALTWGPVINGNIEIFGSDPVFHATEDNPAIAAVTQRGVEFALGQAGKTGAYISLSCYFHGVASQTHVSLLDGLDSNGSGFSVHGVGCSDSIHIEASSPALEGITDELLSNWFCSVHEAFDSWPAKFGVLAVDTDAGSLYTGQDGTTGDPYILAFPAGKFQGTTETVGGGNPASHTNQCNRTSHPVNCATGEFWHTFADLSVPGRGPALNLTRTYSSLRAATDSPFGFGWSSAYTMSLAVDSASGAVQVTQENGATTVFSPSGGGYAAPPRVYATLQKNADGTWTFIRHQRQRFAFDANGRLTGISDLNGYTTALSYNASGQLSSISDPVGRTLTLAYGANNKIAKVTDPAGRSTSYGYDDGGNLTSVTDVAGGTWAFAYDTAHLTTTMTDPRGGKVKNIYDATGRVTSQTDPADRTTTFNYTDSGTTITDPKGNTIVEDYTQGQLVQLTKGAGTSSEATWRYSYDPATLGMTKLTDPNGHVTTYAYDGDSYNPTSSTDPLGRTTTITYNRFEEPLTITDPAGTTSTYDYDSAGNLQSTSQPVSGAGATQRTEFGYGDPTHPGDITALTDPNGKSWQFAYDGNGDLTATTDPLGNKTSYGYDSIGRRTSMVSARGNASGGDPAKHTATYAYDAFGNLTKITDPLGHATSMAYDPNRNRSSLSDPNGHLTSYSYDADNELTKVARADGTTLTFAYDANGNQTTQTDGAGNTTSYGYDPLDRLISSSDPLHRTTHYDYDGAGNRTSLTDPSGRTTNFGYDEANQLTETTYSDGKTPNVNYGYDTNGQRISMADGTGTTTYTYDSLHRLIKSTNGAGASVAYDYDLAGRVTALTYPNGKTVSRTYDAAGRLSTVADWLGNTTSFDHDPDANLTTETYPNGVKTSATFDNADQLTSITHQKGATTLASFNYTRDNLGQLTSSTLTGVPGEPESYSYTQLNQLASLNSKPYGYDHANNLTKLADGTTQNFDAANQLTSSTPPASGPSSPTVDQVVSGDQKTASTKITSPTVKTTAGKRLVLAFVSADGPKGSAQKVAKVTGGGLTWSLAARANDGRGTAEVWQAYATAPVSAAITATLGNGQFDGSITVATFTGAARTVGATAARTAQRASAPSITLKTTKARSLVWAAGHDWDHGSTITPLTGQDLVHQFRDTRVDRTYWAQRTTDAVPTSGKAVTIGGTTPTTDRWELAAVEIPPDPDAIASSSPISYTYDKQGNRTGITPAAGTSTTLNYDQANRLTSYGPSATYSYNGDGLRMSKTVNSATTAFAWDQSEQLPVLLADGSDYYVYGPGGLPVEKISGSTVTYLHHDQQGSTRLLTDAGGAAGGTYTYDPWGNTVGHTGSATTTLQYDGQYTDAETGFQYLRARYYDPITGQFLTKDPIAGATLNSHAYVDNNPLNWFDPTGYFGLSLLGGAIGGVVGGVVGGGAYAVKTLVLHQEEFKPRALVGATAGGLVGGAIGGACVGTTFVVTVCGAVGGGVDTVVDEWISGEPLDPWDIGEGAFFGGMGGALHDPFTSRGRTPYKLINVFSPGVKARLMYGNELINAIKSAAVRLPLDFLWHSEPAC